MATIPTDLLDRIRDIERRIRDLMGSANSSPPMNQVNDGDVVVGDGGRLRVRTSDGEDLLLVGRILPDRSPTQTQQGLQLRRDDGSLALAVSTEYPEGLPVQPLRVYDHRGNIVFATDSTRRGLARPYVPYPLPAPADPAAWRSTGATDWTTLYSGPGFVQHPKVYCRVAVSGSADSSVRLLVDGVPLGPEGGPGAGLTLTEALAADFGDPVTFEVQAKVARSGDTVACQPLALYGVQS
ncbi:hypothetical protein ACFV3R_06840 [Streptomyces sp. NPDC059740]|uniref:hypothetical protein n=1 Tax=Streptomyces sp. NPDC059740 TaxID=3346926 RepID=UPI00364AA68D